MDKKEILQIMGEAYSEALIKNNGNLQRHKIALEAALDQSGLLARIEELEKAMRYAALNEMVADAQAMGFYD